MNLLNRLLGRGCAHEFSWPRSGDEGRYYQRCSRCGIAYEYDWDMMRRTGRVIAVQPDVSAQIRHGQGNVNLPLAR